MTDTRQLRYFVALADHLHFAKAADELGIAQSALSVQVLKLEKEVGARLLNRNKRQPVSLTEVGRMVYEEATAALQHVTRVGQVGRLAARGQLGFVRIGSVASGVSSGLVNRMLKDFRSTHPDVVVELVGMDTPRQLEALAAGEIDLAILRPRRKYPSGLSATIIHNERLMVAIAEDHPLNSKVKLNVSDLANETFITPQLREDEGFSLTLERLAVSGGFSVATEIRVQDFISALTMASAGYGLVLVPESMQFLMSRALRYRPVSGLEENVYLALARRSREYSPATRALLDSALANVKISASRA
ncbi:LysR family transcriptional regulator [Paraburkholderia sp. BL6665CI2N2]|uniref:LysR family transcriptional regulator n=1 Tax=Paraburkholderia sp. BL6665CI2N2 TaxID=1938806 RepID=UPI0010664D56|nr:LysR substrate-binding domain-containing protein [Paraburkholderia sp. BL6665CI2N2]TDY15591.1 LysR family transcriptional regulator [Paraburkholderia sp. BL6665CI2N2]